MPSFDGLEPYPGQSIAYLDSADALDLAGKPDR